MYVFFWLHIFLSATLFRAYLSQNATDTTQCEDNGLSPDDENIEDGGFLTFSEQLETYTGLSNTETFNVTLEGCEGKLCVVNPNGAAIWEARMNFYLGYMKGTQSNETDARTTLDGCLCYSTTLAEYQSCMTIVRQDMIEQLGTVMVADFKNIIENNCTLFDQNCI